MFGVRSCIGHRRKLRREWKSFARSRWAGKRTSTLAEWPGRCGSASRAVSTTSSLEAARASVYRDGADYELFLELLIHTHERYGWFCHAYCLMGNHYHLLVETPKPN